MALGLGRGAFQMAVRYARDREAFGSPIAEFQGIRFLLADVKTELDAAELLIHRAAARCDRGERFTAEASMAKLFASEAATRACNVAMQVHGGYGYTREFDVERHLRDVKLCEIGEGTSQVQRMVIVWAGTGGPGNLALPPGRPRLVGDGGDHPHRGTHRRPGAAARRHARLSRSREGVGLSAHRAQPLLVRPYRHVHAARCRVEEQAAGVSSRLAEMETPDGGT
jgi:hypothetical protein